MTIRLLCAYDKYPANAIVTLDAGTESGLVAAKMADTNLAGGTAYTAPAAPSTKVGGAPQFLYDPTSGDVVGIKDADGGETYFNATAVSWASATYPVYSAHRGGEAAYPENTMVAFRESAASGAISLELDVHTLADGALVVHHDTTTDRTCRDLSGAAVSLTLANLKYSDVLGLDASYKTNTGLGFYGSDFNYNRPPLLQEIFAELKGKCNFIIEAKGPNSTARKSTAQSIATMASRYGISGDLLIYGASGDNFLTGSAIDPRGCKMMFMQNGANLDSAAVAARAAEGYFAIGVEKSTIDATYKALINSAGMKLAGYTYYRADELSSVVPDVVIASDIFTAQDKRLASYDRMQRTYPGYGYLREGPWSGANPGDAPISAPVLRTYNAKRFVGWDTKHSSLSSGRNRFVITNVDVDPNNDGAYQLDWDMVWTELGSDTNQLSMLFFEMQTSGSVQEGASSSAGKSAYYVGVRANGGAVLGLMSGSTPAGSSLATAAAGTAGWPNPPVIGQVYPCRLVVNGSGITFTWDVGGATKTLTTADTTLRGGKFLQVERRGHGYMIGSLRAS